MVEQGVRSQQPHRRSEKRAAVAAWGNFQPITVFHKKCNGELGKDQFALSSSKQKS